MALAMAKPWYFDEHFVSALDARIAITMKASGGVIQGTWELLQSMYGIPNIRTKELTTIDFIDIVEMVGGENLEL